MTRAFAIVAGVVLLTSCGADEDTRRYRVPSSSMEPTLHCARPAPGCEAADMDFVAAHPFGSHKPTRGDLVVFHTPALAVEKCGAGGTFIKRLVGLPGERWGERAGFIYIDGRKLAEPYVRPDRRDTQSYEGERIPAGEFLLLGDNRASSCDSRIWGLVPRSDLIGWVFEIKRGPKRIHIR